MNRLSFSIRVFAILILTVTMVSNVFSQERKNGIRVGIHSAQLKMGNDRYFDKKHKSFYVGVFREQKAAAILKWRTGLEYHENGSYDDGSNFVRLGYIVIPASLGVDIGPLQAFGGASAALNVFTNETIGGEKSDPTINDYDRFDATAFVGAVFKVTFLAFEAQYHWGLTDVTEEFRNRYFELGMRAYF